jgi:hypothetical protein
VLKNKMIARQIGKQPEMHSDVQVIEQPDTQMGRMNSKQVDLQNR